MQKVNKLLVFITVCLLWLPSVLSAQGVEPVAKSDSIAPVDTLSISSWIEQYKFVDSSFHFGVGVDMSRFIWNVLDKSISGYGLRAELFRKPWGIELGYIYEENKTTKSQYSLNERGTMYFVGIHLISDFNTMGVGYAQTQYERYNSQLTYFSNVWRSEFSQPIADYSYTLYSYRFYDRIRVELFSNIFLSLGASLDFITNYQLQDNIPMVWVPGMTIEWSRRFVSRLNFSYSIEYRL